MLPVLMLKCVILFKFLVTNLWGQFWSKNGIKHQIGVDFVLGEDPPQYPKAKKTPDFNDLANHLKISFLPLQKSIYLQGILR